MANIITGCRILCSIILLFVSALSPAFYILYCLAGFTDMIDGTVARKTNTASEFGSKLDTIADIIFAVVCLIKILPHLVIAEWLWIWIGVIAAIKIFNIISGYIVQKKFAAVHTIMNKFTGALLFILPFTLSVIDLKYSGSAVCTIATLAAIHEGHLIRTKKIPIYRANKSNHKGKNIYMFAKAIRISALVFVILTILFTIVYKNTSNTVILSMAITFGTVSYHFLMRLAVGFAVNKIFSNRFDYNKKWFQERKFEKRLYKVLKVKKWKDKMPTFTPEMFNLKLHTPEEIAGAMCQAEVGHTIIIVLCFVPLLAVPVFGAFWVFLITSVTAACVESIFVIMQRYNRPRLLKLIEKQKR